MYIYILYVNNTTTVHQLTLSSQRSRRMHGIPMPLHVPRPRQSAIANFASVCFVWTMDVTYMNLHVCWCSQNFATNVTFVSSKTSVVVVHVI